MTDLLRHVRRLGDNVDRQLVQAKDLESRFRMNDTDDESMASQHFHVDVGGDGKGG